MGGVVDNPYSGHVSNVSYDCELMKLLLMMNWKIPCIRTIILS